MPDWYDIAVRYEKALQKILDLADRCPHPCSCRENGCAEDCSEVIRIAREALDSDD